MDFGSRLTAGFNQAFYTISLKNGVRIRGSFLDVLRTIKKPTPNESVGKVLLTSEDDDFGGYLTLSKHEIVDRGAFCEVIFFYISPKNLLGDFFDSLS